MEDLFKGFSFENGEFVPMTDKEKDDWDTWRNKKKGNLNEIDGIDCSICNNKGVICDWRHGNYNMCSCMSRRIAYNRIRASGLDLNLNFGSYSANYEWQIRIKNEAKSFAQNPIGWFFIGGQSGSGKTHICNATCIELMKTIPVKYLTWRLDASRLKMLMKEEDYFSKLQEILDAECLYIDDLFKGTITEADLNLAFVILDYRGRYKKPTIISSEKTINEIWEKDAALGGRINELCRYGGRYPLTIEGEDKNQRARM